MKIKRYFKLILRAIITLALGYLSKIIIDQLPIPAIQKWEFILFLVALFAFFFILNENLKATKVLKNDRKNSEELPKVRNKKKLALRIIIQYLRKPSKLVVLVLSLISKPYYWRRVCFKLSIIVIFLFILRISVSFYFDAKWDNPKNYSQVVYLNTLWGYQKDELSISWQHFGTYKCQQANPKTYLTSISYGDSLLPLSIFEKQYFTIYPDTLPRNNLTVVIKPVDHDKNLLDSFKKLVTDLTTEYNKGSSGLIPSVYPVQIMGRTPGSELQFIRYFNFRTRSIPEIILYYLFSLSFAIFAFYFVNAPAIIRTLQEDTRVAILLKRIKKGLIQLIENAMHLGSPIAKHNHTIIITINAVIEIHKHSGRDYLPHIVDKINADKEALMQTLQATERFSDEIVKDVKKYINSIFELIQVIHFRRVLKQETKEEFDIFILAIVKAEEEIERQVIVLKQEMDDQEANLKRCCKKINQIREERRKNHERKVKLLAQEIANSLEEQLKELDLPNFIKGLDAKERIKVRAKKPGKPYYKDVSGKGYDKAKVVILIPDPITLNLEWSKSQVVIYPEDKELALIKEPIRINGQDVQQNEIKIDYDVFLEPLSFNLDDFLLKVKIEAIKLALRNTKKYKELYDPITVEEMKKLGLVDIIE